MTRRSSKLGLLPGVASAMTVKSRRIVLCCVNARPARVRIISDTASRLPVLSTGKTGPKLTSGQVAEILADFP